MNEVKKLGHLGSFVPMYQFETCKRARSGLKLFSPVGWTMCEHLGQPILGLQFSLCSRGSGPKWVKSQLRLNTVCVILSLLGGCRPLRPETVNTCLKGMVPSRGQGWRPLVRRLSLPNMGWDYSGPVTYICRACRALQLIVTKSEILDNVGLHC